MSINATLINGLDTTMPIKSTGLSAIFIVIFGLTSACDVKQPAQTKSCPSDKPFYPLCTDASHNKQTWLGGCYTTWEAALQEANAHVAQSHPGEKRWTGVKKNR